MEKVKRATLKSLLSNRSLCVCLRARRLPIRAARNSTLCITFALGKKERERDEVAGVASQKGWPHILVVDDEPAILDLVQRVSNTPGQNVITSPSGDHARDTIERGQPRIDLVLTDKGLASAGRNCASVSIVLQGLRILPEHRVQPGSTRTARKRPGARND